MNYEHLKKFLVVAKNLNISKSAEELFITQPALSKTIAELEKELNHKLFVRKSNGLMLTEAGQQLFDNLQNHFIQIDKTIEHFQNEDNAKFVKLRIGSGITITKKFLTEKLSILLQKFPGIKIEFKSLKIIDCIKELKEGKIDLFLTNTEITNENDFVFYELKELHDCLIGGTVYKHLSNEKINFYDLKYYSIITSTKTSATRTSFNNFCKELNLSISPTVEVEHNGFLIELVKLNMGIGYTTYEFIQDEIDNKTLFKLDTIQELPTRKLSLVTNKNNTIPLFNEFLNILLEK